MDNFIVSARKYRPATFNTVVGQAHITNTLKNAIKNNHLAQAFLFCGPRGVGKTTCARILAKTINCFHPTAETEACDSCESCVSFNSGQSLNVYELDAASNNSVDDIRALVDQVRFAPQLGQYKVYIIDEVHMLSQAAFNAFLKTLEEPPRHAIFILATTERHKILPTILSRCQIFNFNRIQVEDIAHHLAFIANSEQVTADADALHIIAQKADGALRDACSIFDQIVSFAGNNVTYKAVIENLNVLDYDYYFKVTDSVLTENIPQALLLFNEILGNGFDGHSFVAGLAEHFRNLLVCKDPATIQLLEVGANIKDKYKEQSQKSSVPLLLKGLGFVNQCDMAYKGSKNPRLQVELALMRLCSINGSVMQEPEKKNDLIVASKSVTTPVLAQQSTVSASIPSTTQATPVSKIAIKPTVPSMASVLNPSVAKAQAANVEVDDKTAENIVDQSGMDTHIDQEKLKEVWNSYALQMQEQKKHQLYSTLSTHSPRVKEAGIIELPIDNKAQDELLEAEKANIMVYLRKELNNPHLRLITHVLKADAAEKKVFTAAEKFKRMAEKNPLLHKLRQQFDLDIEY
jgi:DNA polymerase III subunit gamma/tau